MRSAVDTFIGTQPNHAPEVEYREVQHTLSRLLELQAALVEMSPKLAEQGVVVVSVVTDDASNRVVVGLTDPDPAHGNLVRESVGAREDEVTFEEGTVIRAT